MTKFWNIWGATIIWLLSMVVGAAWHFATVEVRLARIETRLEMLLHIVTPARMASHRAVQTSAHGE